MNVGNLSATLSLTDLFSPVLANAELSLDSFVQAAAKYEVAITKISVLTAAQPEMVDQWSKALLRLGPEVAKGPEDLAKAMYFVASHGIMGAQALEVVGLAAKASAIGMGETAEIARAVTAQMNAYHTSGMTAVQTTNILIEAIRQGGMPVDQLIGSLGRVTPIAAQMKIGLADVAAYIAIFSKLGVNADVAATALRGFLAEMMKTQNTSPQVAAAFAAVGLKISDIRDIIKDKGLAEGMKFLVDSFEKAGKGDLLEQAIPNIRALTGLLAAAGEQGEDFIRIQKEIRAAGAGEKGDIATESFARMSETLDLQLKKLSETFKALQVAVGTMFLPTVKVVVSGMQLMVPSVEQLITVFNELPDLWKEVGAGAIVLLAAIVPMAIAFTGFLAFLPTLIAGLLELGPLLVGLFGASTATSIGAVTIAIATWAAGFAAAVAVFTVFYGITTLVVNNFDSLSGAFTDFFERNLSPTNLKRLKEFVEYLRQASGVAAVQAGIDAVFPGPGQVGENVGGNNPAHAGGVVSGMSIQEQLDRLDKAAGITQGANALNAIATGKDGFLNKNPILTADQIKVQKKSLEEMKADLLNFASFQTDTYHRMLMKIEADRIQMAERLKDKNISQGDFDKWAGGAASKAMSEWMLSELGPNAQQAEFRVTALNAAMAELARTGTSPTFGQLSKGMHELTATLSEGGSVSADSFINLIDKIIAKLPQLTFSQVTTSLRDMTAALEQGGKIGHEKFIPLLDALSKKNWPAATKAAEAENTARGKTTPANFIYGLDPSVVIAGVQEVAELDRVAAERAAKREQIIKEAQQQAMVLAGTTHAVEASSNNLFKAVEALADELSGSHLKNGIRDFEEAFAAMDKTIKLTGASLDNFRDQLQDFVDKGGKATPEMLKMAHMEVIFSTKSLSGIKDLVGALGQLKDVVGGSLGGALDVIGSIGSTIASLGDKSVQGASNFTKAANAISAAANIISASREERDQDKRSESGALQGAAAGAQFGPVGMMVGAFAGYFLAYFSGPSWAGAANIAAGVLGQYISNDLAKQIEKTMNSLRIAAGPAALLHLTDAIAESGKATSKYSYQFMELMAGIADGSVPATEGVKELNDAFSQLQSEGESATRAIHEVMTEARRLGGDAFTDKMHAFASEQLDKGDKGILAGVQGIKIITPEDARSQASIALMFFWETWAEEGPLAAAKAFDKIVQVIQESLDKIGGDSLAQSLLDPIHSLVDLIGDGTTLFAGAVSGAQGLADALSAIGKAGMAMTRDQFSAFEEQAQTAKKQAYDDAIAQGKTESEAQALSLLAIAPLLMQLIQMADLYGFSLSAGTEELKKQAQEAGIAWPVSPIERMVDAIDRLIAALLRVPRDLTVTTHFVSENPPPPPPGGGVPGDGVNNPRPGDKTPGTDMNPGDAGNGAGGTSGGGGNSFGISVISSLHGTSSSQRSSNSRPIYVDTVVLPGSTDPKAHAQAFLKILDDNTLGARDKVRRLTK